MFDGCPDTCWHSKEGKPQSISLEFASVRCRAARYIPLLPRPVRGRALPCERACGRSLTPTPWRRGPVAGPHGAQLQASAQRPRG